MTLAMTPKDRLANAVSEWWAFIRRHPVSAAVVLLALFCEKLVEDRIISGTNSRIDQHTDPLLAYLGRAITWLASNPLGITGIVAIFVLLIVFIHAYVAGPRPLTKRFNDALVGELRDAEDFASDECRATTKYTAKISGAERVEFNATLDGARSECSRLHLNASCALIDRFKHDIADDSEWVKVYFRCRILLEVIEDECKREGTVVSVRPPGTFVTLRDAASEVYTIIRDETVVSVLTKMMKDDPETILDHWAGKIADKIALVYGINPPATTFKLIPSDEFKRMGVRKSGAEFFDQYSGKTLWTDLQIRKSRFDRLKRNLKGRTVTLW